MRYFPNVALVLVTLISTGNFVIQQSTVRTLHKSLTAEHEALANLSSTCDQWKRRSDIQQNLILRLGLQRDALLVFIKEKGFTIDQMEIQTEM